MCGTAISGQKLNRVETELHLHLFNAFTFPGDVGLEYSINKPITVKWILCVAITLSLPCRDIDVDDKCVR